MGIAGFGMLCVTVGLVQTIIRLVKWLSWKRKGVLVEGELTGSEISDVVKRGKRTTIRYRHTFLIRDNGQDYTCYYYEKVPEGAIARYKKGVKTQFFFDRKKEMILDSTVLKVELRTWATIFGGGVAMMTVGILLFVATKSCK